MLPYKIPIAIRLISTSVSRPFCLRKVRHKEGDPLAMAIYGIAILPLISRLHNDSLTQKWYADDGSVVGKLKDIRAVFDKLTHLGPNYGYLVNPPVSVDN